MFLFKKILTPFLLPPGIFILALMLSGLWFLYNKQRKTASLNLVLGIALWLFAIAPVSDALLGGLESKHQMPKNAQGDVIILLGGGVYYGIEDFSGKGAPSDEMLSRLVTAVRLQKRLNVPIIVSGGVVFAGQISEASIDKRFLVDLGVPANKIFIEERSRDTFENARYTKEICERYHFKKPLLITSAYHLERSLWSFRKFGIEVTPYPANFHTHADRRYSWNDYLPGDLRNSSAALREYLGLLFYKMAY